jgi:hypothetical protein
MNTDEIKYQGQSTKVMGYKLKYVKGFNQSITDAALESTGRNWSTGATAGGSSARGTSHIKGSGGSTGKGTAGGISFLIDPAVDAGLGLFFGHADTPQTIHTSNVAQTNQAWNEGHAENLVDTESWAAMEMEGGSEASATSTARTVGESLMPMYEPQMGLEPQPPIYRTVEEQIFRATQFLSALPDRQCVARIVGEPRSSLMTTQTIPKPLTTPEWTEEYVQGLLGPLDFALPLTDAISRIKARGELIRRPSNVEPGNIRRKIGSRRSQ